MSTAGGFNINCAGESTGSINVIPVNAVGNVSFLWSDGNSSQLRENLPAGHYEVILTDENSCTARDTISLEEPPPLQLVFADTINPFCPDKPDGSLGLTVSGGVPGYSYTWSDDSHGSGISNIAAGMYSVRVVDLNGCSVKDSIFLEPQNELCLIIPNAISPNGDDINDFWTIGEIELYPDIEIKIFDSWGILVWQSAKGYPQRWDGTSRGRKLPIDSYHYMIDLHNGTKPIIGSITIVR
jgi:gliding motility-associated-like protein